MDDTPRPMTETPLTFPIRINRYLALKGFSTRGGGDELIAAGRVLINGAQARIGQKVSADDTVTVVPAKGAPARAFRYIAYHKPAGIVTHSPKPGERGIADVAHFPDVFPVGRLDKATRGLIILTDDGRVTERLLHPRFVHEKEYEVTVRERAPHVVAGKLERGVVVRGEKLIAARVRVTGRHTLTIVLTEGKKHQVRRMLAKVDLTVTDLVRTRIMGIRLGSLRAGAGRILTGAERADFLANLGLDADK